MDAYLGGAVGGTGWVYGAALAVSAGAMALVDRRWRLVGPRDSAVTAAVVAGGVLGLLAWDALGIVTGIFFRGQGPWLTGWQLAPELPVEEVLFLAFLTHVALVADAATGRLLEAGPRGRALVRRASAVVGVVLAVVLVVSTGLGGGLRGTWASLAYAGVIAAVLVPVLALATLWGRGQDEGRGRDEGRGQAVGGGPGGSPGAPSGARLRRRPWDLRARGTLAVLALLTAVFDSAIVGAGIVAYDWSRTSGLLLGLAPVEDLGYSVAVCALAPVAWQRWHERRLSRGRVVPGSRPASPTPTSASHAGGPATRSTSSRSSRIGPHGKEQRA